MLRLSALFTLICCLALPVSASASAGVAVVMTLNGAIGPASVRYLTRGLARAADQDARLVVLEIDTPGGLASSTQSIVRAILHSPVPVAGLVFPAGARAASAGTYILYACPVAAMSPATHLGAATPIAMGKSDTADPAARKRLSDAAASLRALATRYGRNVDWGDAAVHKGASLTAAEAQRMHVIDLVATSPEALILALDGRRVRVGDGWQTLKTADLTVERDPPGWQDQLLAWIADPNVAYLLLLIGFYGIVFELAGPGLILPGTAGAISLILALFALQALPIDYGGLGLMLLGIGLMVGETFVAGFGVLGLGGVVAFTAGSLLLFDTHDIRVSLPMIGGTAAISAGFFLWLIGRLIRLRRRGAVTGREAILGAQGVVTEDFTGHGHIHLHGELWQANCNLPLRRDQRVRVVAIDGLELTVTPEEN